MNTESLCLPRRSSRTINVGNCSIGSSFPIRVQSMTNTDGRDVDATLQQIKSAAKAGAEMMRVSVPDTNVVDTLPAIIDGSPIPIIADIHFDYKLALGVIRQGVHKLRINPGNIGSRDKIRSIVSAAKDNNISIRVGVNAGSLEKDLLKKYGYPTADALAESAIRNAGILQEEGFNDIILSLKSSDVTLCVNAYRKVSKICDFPLHIGITEAGTLMTGAIRSTVGLSLLLSEGIGDTVRVSLAADPVQEIITAYKILDALQIRQRGPRIIACPTCGRTQVDIIKIANEVENRLSSRTANLTVAVMGCVVNGPGEAKEADIGVAGGRGEGLLFRKGKPVRKVQENEIIDALIDLFDQIAEEK